MNKKSSLDPQLKLFDDTPYIQLQQPDVVPDLKDEISDIVQVTNAQLQLNFDDIHRVVDTTKESISLRQYLSTLSDAGEYFPAITEKMQKYGFNKLSNFNDFFGGLLFQVMKDSPSDTLNKTTSDSLTDDEYLALGSVVLNSFALRNKTIPYPFRGTRYKQMEKICFDKFFSLMSLKKKYTPDVIKKYYLAINEGDAAFAAKKYNLAVARYRVASIGAPEASYPREGIMKSLSNILWRLYFQARKSHGLHVESSQNQEIFSSVFRAMKSDYPLIDENMRQEVESKVRTYISAYQF